MLRVKFLAWAQRRAGVNNSMQSRGVDSKMPTHERAAGQCVYRNL